MRITAVDLRTQAQISGGSRISSTGVPSLKVEASTYFLTNLFPKTEREKRASLVPLPS